MGVAFEREDERRDDYDREQLSTSPYAYLQRGRYVEYVDAYARHFPRERMKILLYEHLTASLAVVQDLYGWLGAAADFEPSAADEVINASRTQTDAELSADQLARLRERFAPLNAALAERYGLDLGAWQRS